MQRIFRALRLANAGKVSKSWDLAFQDDIPMIKHILLNSNKVPIFRSSFWLYLSHADNGGWRTDACKNLATGKGGFGRGGKSQADGQGGKGGGAPMHWEGGWGDSPCSFVARLAVYT